MPKSQTGVQITLAKEKSISLKISSNENKRRSFSKQQKKNKIY
jgi:hypothetical protein